MDEAEGKVLGLQEKVITIMDERTLKGILTENYEIESPSLESGS